jgi:hypothetical protein
MTDPIPQDGSIALSIGRYRFAGEKRKGRWKFRSNHFPEVAEKFNGVQDASEAIEEFTRLANEGKVKR